MAGLPSLASNGLIDTDLLQQIGQIQWASSGDSKLASQLATMKIVGTLWQRFSGEAEIDALRTETIMRISKYVKDNPKASKEQLSKEIGKEIDAFAKNVQKL